MAQLVIPNVFVNGTVADADPVNQNFDAVRASVNSVDNTNIGPLGIYARQIIPTDRGQAVFGGNYGYKFHQRLVDQVELQIEAATGGTADLLQIIDPQANKWVWIASDFTVHVLNDFNGSTAHFSGAVHAGSLHSKVLDATDQGEINFADNGQIGAYPPGLGVRMIAGAAYNWATAALVVKATANAVAIYVTDTGSRPHAWYYGGGYTGGQTVTNLPQIGFLDTGGRMFLSQGTAAYMIGNSYTPGSVACGFGYMQSGGMYLGWGFHYDNATASFIADSGTALGIVFGGVTGFGGQQVLFFVNSGLVTGAAFLPNWWCGYGNGGANMGAIIAPNGIQCRSGGATGGNGAILWSGSGNPPPNTMGNNGDFYFSTNAPGQSLQRIFVKNNSGNWVGIV